METESIQIPIEAVDKFSAITEKAEGELSGLTAAEARETAQSQRSAEQASKTSASFTELHSAYSTALDVINLGAKAWEATVGELDKYASEVEKVSRLTGQSAEESSKLIQVSDDLFISTEKLTSALTIAGKKYDVSIEGIAKLSDEYLALENSTERNAFASEHFGKNYGEMVKLLEAGGDTIRNMAANQPEGLILGDKDIQQIRAYRREIDAASDSWQAFTLQIGGKALGVFNDIAVQEHTNNILMEEGNDVIAKKIMSHHSLTDAEWDTYNAAKAQAEAQYYQKDALDESGQSAEDAAANLEEMSRKNNELFSTMESFQGVVDSYNEKQSDLKENEAELLDQKQQLIDKGYKAESQELQNINAKLAENAQLQREAADAAKEALSQKVAGLIESKLTSDGSMSDADLNAILEVNKAFGLMDEKTVMAVKGVNAAVNEYLETGQIDKFRDSVEKTASSLLNLPSEKTINLNLVTKINGKDVTSEELEQLLAAMKP